MHKLSTSTLFHQLLTEIKCPFLYSIVSSNENNIINQVNSFSLDKCTFVELFIQLDLLTLCNQFPSIANQLFSNSCSILQYVKENVIQILTKLLKNLTNLTEKFEKLIFLFFQFENIPFLNYFNFREFYFTIHNQSIKESNLILIEGKYSLIKKKVGSLLKYYRCTNDVCSQSCYIIEQESHLPDKSQVNYFLVDKIENTIKTMIDIDQFNCPHCKNELKENITERNVKFLYFYIVYDKLFFINGISFNELKNDLILIGQIKRINLIPYFFILCYYKKEELKSNFINYTAINTRYSSLPLLLKNIYNFSHSSFILDDITHINLHLILSIFLIKEIRLVIFTNDPLFVNNYAQSYFKLHSLNIKISIEEDSHLQNELLIYNEKNIHQLNYSNYNFIIEVKKCFINYEYKSNNRRILLNKHEMKENDIQFVQKIFLNLRKVFKNNISLVKLLDVINNINEALYFYLGRIPNEDDLRIVEQTCAKCLVPDLKIKK